jgi:hypothetical protein
MRWREENLNNGVCVRNPLWLYSLLLSESRAVLRHLQSPGRMADVLCMESILLSEYVSASAPGLIPLFPSEVKFSIHDSKNPKSQIHRRQFALVAGYAFTDHKAQGQTIENVIVDIGPTKRFSVDAFAAYVALSRSRGRETIRLLRDFDDKIFTKHPWEHLRAEDGRLDALSLQTKIRFAAGAYEY